MKVGNKQPLRLTPRMASALYSNVAVTLCTVLSLGVLVMKAPQAGGD
jgi:hypothetical protein